MSWYLKIIIIIFTSLFSSAALCNHDGAVIQRGEEYAMHIYIYF